MKIYFLKLLYQILFSKIDEEPESVEKERVEFRSVEKGRNGSNVIQIE